MELLKFATCAVVFCVVIMVVKNQEKQVGLVLSIACSLILTLSVLDSAVSAFEKLSQVFEMAKIDTSLFESVLKIVGVAYISELAGSICEEAGTATLASKVRIFGKITVLLQTIPLIENFITIVGGLL